MELDAAVVNILKVFSRSREFVHTRNISNAPQGWFPFVLHGDQQLRAMEALSDVGYPVVVDDNIM
jgi:hypothetical protein